MARGIYTCLLLLAFVTFQWSLCFAQSCTVNDIQGIQPNISISLEKLDGHWFVTHVFDATRAATAFSSYTVDVVPTVDGLTLYSNSNSSQNADCDYTATELKSTSETYRFSISGVDIALTARASRTLLVAAANNDVTHALLYICSGDVTAEQPCASAMALVVGRQANATSASDWLNSVSSSLLPCMLSVDAVVVQQGEECALKPFWGLSGRNCDSRNFPVQASFNLTKYISAKWYEMAWLAPSYIDPSFFYQDYEHEYRLLPGGNLTIFIAGRDQAKDECFFNEVSLTKTGTPGKLVFDDGKAAVPYSVIKTDYDHYAVVFGCSNSTSDGVCREARGWLWSRGKTLDRQYRLQAFSTMQDICLNPAAFFSTEHTNECIKDTSGSVGLHHINLLPVASLILVKAIIA